MNNILNILVIGLLLLSSNVQAQSWTLRMTIDTALHNNLGLQIARNDAAIAANNNSVGAAGMLPRADINAVSTIAENDIRQEFRTGEVLETSGVRARNTTASAELSWTIFNGFRMFATRERLKSLEELGELSVKQQVIALVARTASLYFELQRQQLLVEFSRNGLGLYEERVRLAEKKLSLGSSPRTELLQATVDYNEQLSLLTSREYALSSARVLLNGIMMRPVTDSIVATDSIYTEALPGYDVLLSRVQEGNLDLREQLILQEIAASELQEARSFYYPLLDLNAGYRYSSNSTTQGFFLENQSQGPVAGITFNWNLFNGLNTRREVKNARIMQENAKLSAMQINQDVQVALRNSWLKFSAMLTIYEREKQSTDLASQNVDIMSERFRLGESTVLELRETQSTFEASQARLADAYYNVRIAMLELQQLTGELN
jgi:outer membrane protein TolC